MMIRSLALSFSIFASVCLAADRSINCPAAFRAYSAGTPPLDLLINPATKAVVDQDWRPLWNILEGEFERLLLVNPQHIKGLDGRKTDRQDAQWIAELLEDGRLRGVGCRRARYASCET